MLSLLQVERTTVVESGGEVRLYRAIEPLLPATGLVSFALVSIGHAVKLVFVVDLMISLLRSQQSRSKFYLMCEIGNM
jgi:hypothetical protein